MPQETAVLLTGIVLLTAYALVMSWLYASRTAELEERSLLYLVSSTDDPDKCDLDGRSRRN